MLTPVEMFCSCLEGATPSPDRKGGRKYAHVTDNAEHSCVMCGEVRAAGLLAREKTPSAVFFGQSFNDMNSLSPGRFQCDMCRTASEGSVLPWTGNVLIARDGILRFAVEDKDAFPDAIRTVAPKEIPRLMLDPPQPPFAWVMKTFLRKEAEHVIWKAKVSLSRDVFYVQVGATNSILVDRDALRATLLWVRGLLDAEFTKTSNDKERRSLYYRILEGYTGLPKWAKESAEFMQVWTEGFDDVPHEILELLGRVYPPAWAHFVSEVPLCDLKTKAT